MLAVLRELLEDSSEDETSAVKSVDRMLSRDAALVVTMNDGSEFQLTIVQSSRKRA